MIEPELEKYPALKKASRVIHTDVTVSMHDKPSQALRRGRKISSMWLAIDAVKKGEADVAISAGNTGALMAMARFYLHTMPGIDRPAIAGDMADRRAAIPWCSISAPPLAATRIIWWSWR